MSSNTTTSAEHDAFRPDMQNLSDFATHATLKTTRFGVRDAKCNAAGAMHRVAWALHESWRTRKKCGFFREKHDFSAEDKGFERLAVSKAIPSIDVPRDAKYDARRKQATRRLLTTTSKECSWQPCHAADRVV
jgi:hypothetical protein